MCVQLLSHSYLTLCLLQGKHCSKCFMCIISHNNPKYFSCINSFNSPNNLRSRHDYYVPFYTYAQDPGASKWCGQDLNPGSLALEPVLWNAKPPNTQSDGDNPFLKNAKFLIPFNIYWKFSLYLWEWANENAIDNYHLHLSHMWAILYSSMWQKPEGWVVSQEEAIEHVCFR